LLRVHPDYRRQGVAASLARWRVDYIQLRLGEEGIIMANIQKGNTGSQKTCRKWCNQYIDRLVIIPAKMLPKPPSPISYLSVRLAKPSELEEIGEKLNQFYQAYNLYEPQTGEHLGQWLEETPFDTPFRHYIIVTNKANDILAGLAVVENYRIRSLNVCHIPFFMDMFNKVVNLIPANGILHELLIEKMWYAPGQLKAAQYLWDSIRWDWREPANLVNICIDFKSPLVDIFQLRPWMIKYEGSIAISGSVAISTERLICPII